MNTTALIVEIVVIGYTALTWIAIIILVIIGKDVFSLLDKLNTYKDISALLAIMATSFAYQFGWLLDYLSYRGFYYKWRNVIKIVKGDDDDDKSPSKIGIARKWKHDALIDDGEFWNEYMTVCKDGEAQVYSELISDLSIVRFTRCGIINFSLLTIAIILYFFRFNIPIYYSIPVLLIGVLIVVLCFNTMQNRWIHWYKKIHKASDLIKGK